MNNTHNTLEPPFDYSRLRGRIVEKYGTIKEFSKRTRFSYNVASMKLNGKITFSQDDMEEWCGLLDIDRIDIGHYFFCPLGSKNTNSAS